MLIALLKLIKYKLTLAVTLSAAAGYLLFPDWSPNKILPLVIGVFLLAGGSAALNEFQERHLDRLMARTRNRPLPAGKISPTAAMLVASLLICSGAAVLASTGLQPVLLGLANVLIYNGLYTTLKLKTSFAVLPGGLVGAIPPLIGWTAAGGPLIHPTILFVATLMFLWQMPHFWLLIIRYGKEYEEAGFRTIKGRLDENQTKRLIFLWMGLSSVFLLTAPLFGVGFGPWLLAFLALINLLLIGVFYIVLFRRTSDTTLRLIFILTNVFLTIVLLALVLSSVL